MRLSARTATIVVVLTVLSAVRAGFAEDASPAGSASEKLRSLRAVQDSLLRTMLRSGSDADVAWAAYAVGKERRTSLRSDVGDALSNISRERDTEEGRAVARSLLAAAVDTGLVVSWPVLEPFLAGLSESGSATVLLLRGTDADLLAGWDVLSSEVMPAAQIALANRLLERRTLGFCLRLLRGVTFEVQVVLKDCPAAPRKYVRSFGRVPVDAEIRRLTALPPTIDFGVSRVSREGSTVLSKGPIDVFVHRREAEGDLGTGIELSDGPEVCRRYLAALLGFDPDLRLPLGKAIEVEWISDREFSSAVSAVQREYEVQYWGVVDDAIGKGLLSRAEAALLSPNLKAKTWDERGGDLPVPAVPELRPSNPYR